MPKSSAMAEPRTGIAPMRWVALVAAMLCTTSEVRAAQDDPPVYAVTPEPHGIKPPTCRLRITYPAGEGMTRFTLSERQQGLFWVTATTTDPAMFGKEIHLVIDGLDAASVRVGPKIEGRDYGGGLFGRDWRTGRYVMRRFALAAETATSVRFRVPGKEVAIPLEGLKEAVVEYEQCRTIRWA